MRKAAIVLGVSARSNLENNHNTTTAHNLDTNATPTRRPARPPIRTPLQSKDGNAMMRVPPNLPKAPLASRTGNAKMYEKQNVNRQPTLAASAKTSNRAPLTPRVAGSTIQPGSTTATTPLSRRTPRPENTTPNGVAREDISTPVSSFLGSNITPRSASRKSRIDSPSPTTPNGTSIDYPSPNEPRLAQNGQAYNGGLGIFSGGDRDASKKATVSFSPGVYDAGLSRPQSQNSTSESKFFFASDAKPVAPPARPPLPTKTSSSTFLYANGQTIPTPPPSSYTPSGSVAGDERTQPKFFHANGTELPPPMSYQPPRPSSVLSSSSRASPRIGTISPVGPLSPPQRPVSPAKLNVHASISTLRNTPNLPSPITPRPQPTGRGQSANNIIPNRRTSFEGQRLSTHSRSPSVGEIKVVPTRRVSGSGASYVDPSPLGSPLNLSMTANPLSTLEEQPQDDLSSGLRSPRSPIKTGKTMEELNELAANARRERKVLDLEITNSSLEAINRTLEREMRKQTAELRRYRRLSRSGRISINTGDSMRSVSSNLSAIDGELGTTLSDMSEAEEEDLEEEEEFTEDEYSDDASLSASAMAESDARHRSRDEKRLQLDLSKHQQLLVDSQKMNQSLKRCLNWTEVLINEGKKALEYNVKISDVELGGRVLALDEVEERQREQEDNEGMSEIGAQMLREARARQAAVAKQINDDLEATVAWSSDGRDDRDSGIELDAAQREQYAGMQ